jgi:hypothetical protein
MHTIYNTYITYQYNIYIYILIYNTYIYITYIHYIYIHIYVPFLYATVLSHALQEHYADKNKHKLIQMSCTAYIEYTFHLSLHHANFGQIRAKQVNFSEFAGVHIIY